MDEIEVKRRILERIEDTLKVREVFSYKVEKGSRTLRTGFQKEEPHSIEVKRYDISFSLPAYLNFGSFGIDGKKNEIKIEDAEHRKILDDWKKISDKRR